MDKALRFKDFIKAENLFRIGILTLASAPSLSSIFFLIAILSVKNSEVNVFEDKWNIPLIISSFLMIIGLVYLNTNVNSSILKNNQLVCIFSWMGFWDIITSGAFGIMCVRRVFAVFHFEKMLNTELLR